MRQFYGIWVVLLLSISQLNGQTLSDALRLSYFNPSSTGRTLGMGGSMSALGGDFGSITINPAGIGTYRSNEFMFTPSAYNSQTNSSFQGQTEEERASINLKLDNIGMVFHHKPSSSNWKTSNFVIGLNKSVDLNQSFTFKGSSKGSITERFVERANGKDETSFDLFEAKLAWDAYAIDPHPSGEEGLFTNNLTEDDVIYKEQFVESQGRVSELFFGFGGNINDKMQIGGTIGIPLVRYQEEKTYTEIDTEDELPKFKKLEYYEFLNTTGTGINAKLGLIYNMSKFLRIGAAVHSPNYYVLTDNYRTSLSNDRDDIGLNEIESIQGTFKYKIASPWKAVGSLGGIIKAEKFMGLIHAEVEYLDYRNAAFNLSAFSSNDLDKQLESDLNDQVEDQLKSAVNYKLGGELATGKIRLRGGLHLNGSPYGKDTQSTYFMGYSYGLGYRSDDFFIDAGYRISTINEGYIPYLVLDQERQQLVENEIKNKNFVLTIGFKF